MNDRAPYNDQTVALNLLRRHAAHSPARGKIRRTVRCRQDPRVPASLYRRRGSGSRHSARTDPDDAIVATYREHGHALVRGMSHECHHGRDVRQAGRLLPGPGRLYAPVRRGDALLMAATPSWLAACRLAVGLALADKMQGKPRVTACFFGDGAVAEGEFHESMNLAALWQLPVLFCCENNLYAMGTSLARSESQTDLLRQGGRVMVPAESGDGMDVVAVQRRRKKAVDLGAGRRRSLFHRIPHLPLPRPFHV